MVMNAPVRAGSRPNGLGAGTPVVRMEGITKAFPGVVALHGVSLDLHAGEVHTIAGENGSGKSTLVKILAGVHRADGGRVSVGGVELGDGGVPAALRHGITLISQEGSLVPQLSVAENMFLGRRHVRRLGRIDWRATAAAAAARLADLEVDIDPGVPVASLPVHQQQIVELARALTFDARVLALDEPTSSLDPHEVDVLLRLLRRLAASGTAVVFISHRMGEMLEVSDRVTVLRDGAVVAAAPRDELDADWLVSRMVGRSLDALYSRRRSAPGATVLEVRGLADRQRRVRGVSLDLRAGEVVGLAGLDGAGRTELLETIAGLRPRAAGSVAVDGCGVGSGPAQMLSAGVAIVPDDRGAKGLVPLSVRENMLLARRGPALSRTKRSNDAVVRTWCDRLRIRCAHHDVPIATLSGGNQQKVLFARCLIGAPRVLLLDEPARGVDIGGKADIYEIIGELTAGGIAVLLASSELPEVLALCDRVLVMQGGRVVAELEEEQLTEDRIIAAATGVDGRG